MSQAARVGDHHTCPLVGSGHVPHVGGAIVGPGSQTVLIGGSPAARVGDTASCQGPPDKIAGGSATVLIESQPVARVGDPTIHGGVIATGLPTVLIG